MRVSVNEAGLVLGYAVIDGVEVSSASKELKQEMRVEEAAARKRWTIQDLVGSELFKVYRDLWWRYSVDPTKLRPSGEALVRRVLSGKQLYQINNVVDAMNIESIRTGFIRTA